MVTPEPGQAREIGPGACLGRYRIVRPIGRGGMATVWEAIHVELEKRVAVKALLATLATEPEVRERFIREAQAASSIRHPHVVDIFDVGTADGIPFLVMEYLEGEELGVRLQREAVLSAESALEILLPVCSAMAAAHDRGIVHRDLKPANIFLARRSGAVVPKVLDFGISKRVDEGLKKALTTTGALLGTPYYMAPEQARGDRSIDARADLYSVGVLLYQCLTGRRPVEGDSVYEVLHAIVEGTFPPPRALNRAIPPALEAVVLRALARSPADRYPDLRALGAALFPFASPGMKARFRSELGGSDTGGLDAASAPTEIAHVPLVSVVDPLADSLVDSDAGLLPVVALTPTPFGGATDDTSCDHTAAPMLERAGPLAPRPEEATQAPRLDPADLPRLVPTLVPGVAEDPASMSWGRRPATRLGFWGAAFLLAAAALALAAALYFTFEPGEIVILPEPSPSATRPKAHEPSAVVTKGADTPAIE